MQQCICRLPVLNGVPCCGVEGERCGTRGASLTLTQPRGREADNTRDQSDEHTQCHTLAERRDVI